MIQIRTRPFFILPITIGSCFAQRAPITPQLTFAPYHASGMYNLGETVGWTVTPGPVQFAATTNYVLLKEGRLDLSPGCGKIEVTVDESDMIYFAHRTLRSHLS